MKCIIFVVFEVLLLQNGEHFIRNTKSLVVGIRINSPSSNTDIQPESRAVVIVDNAGSPTRVTAFYSPKPIASQHVLYEHQQHQQQPPPSHARTTVLQNPYLNRPYYDHATNVLPPPVRSIGTIESMDTPTQQHNALVRQTSSYNGYHPQSIGGARYAIMNGRLLYYQPAFYSGQTVPPTSFRGYTGNNAVTPAPPTPSSFSSNAAEVADQEDQEDDEENDNNNTEYEDGGAEDHVEDQGEEEEDEVAERGDDEVETEDYGANEEDDDGILEDDEIEEGASSHHHKKHKKKRHHHPRKRGKHSHRYNESHRHENRKKKSHRKRGHKKKMYAGHSQPVPVIVTRYKHVWYPSRPPHHHI